MFDLANENLFLYVIIGAAIAMALLWFFVIAPIEKRNHERKLALLQERIRNHEEKMGGTDNHETNENDDNTSG